jgi:hypothetical protein
MDSKCLKVQREDTGRNIYPGYFHKKMGYNNRDWKGRLDSLNLNQREEAKMINIISASGRMSVSGSDMKELGEMPS